METPTGQVREIFWIKYAVVHELHVRSFQDSRGRLSRYAQPGMLDLSSWSHHVPVELIGGTIFPQIGKLPYFITLGAHGFYWFKLEQPVVEKTETLA